MLRAEGLTKRYGEVIALDHLDLDISPGVCLALFGPNGAGKSTLLSLLAGLSRPSSGTIQFQNRSEECSHRRRIGFLGHTLMLYGKLTAEENLRFFASMYEMENIDECVRNALVRVGLENRAQDLVYSFSRGMRQRLAIARATLHEPELLLLDEPYTGLDPVAAEHATGLFRELHTAGRTLVVITHDLAQGLALADRVLVLNHGRAVLKADEPVRDPEAFRLRYFQVVSGQPGGGQG